MEDKLLFTYTIVSKKQYDTMLTLENGIVGNRVGAKFEEKAECVEEELTPRPTYIPQTPYNIVKFAYSTKKLEKGKEYDLILYPKTCSVGFAFVKEVPESKE
jgi:hypothetical protein